MKKVFATILTVLYLASVSGATITTHYCMGKVYSIDLVNKDKCAKCGMKKAKGCCRDEVKIVKVQDTHQLVNQQTHFTPSFAILETIYCIYKSTLPQAASLSATNNNSPPGSSLCILNCVFRL